MRVQDVMSKTVASCRADTNLADATALMWEHNCGLLPIVNHEGMVIGVVTDRDICVALGTRDRRASEIKVSEVAYRAAVLCNAQDDLRPVLKVMAAERVRRLPVVDQKGTLIGVLSLDDVTLRARHHDDTDRPEVSFEDVVNTLRAIYKGRSRARRSAGA